MSMGNVMHWGKKTKLVSTDLEYVVHFFCHVPFHGGWNSEMLHLIV